MKNACVFTQSEPAKLSVLRRRLDDIILQRRTIDFRYFLLSHILRPVWAE